MKIEQRRVEKIRPYENNPRVNDMAVDAVARSIEEFGFRQPVVIDSESVIVCGHTRWKAAQKLGLKAVPVHVATDLTPDQIRAYRIADNKLAELATWDVELLQIELADLQAADIDLSIIGFSDEMLAQLAQENAAPGQTDPDSIPEPPDAATTKRGRVYELGNHRLMCGDSGSVADVDVLLHGVSVSLVNTDPPYNVNVEPRSNNAIAAGLSTFRQGTTSDLNHHRLTHHQGFDLRRGKSKAHGTTTKMRPKDRPLENDFVSGEEFDRLLAAWFGNIARTLQPGGVFYVWGGYGNFINYPVALRAASLYFSQAIVWVKEHPVLTRKDFMGNHEWCFYGWREGGGHKFYGPNNVRDTWQLSRAHRGNVAIDKGVNLTAADGSRIAVMPPQEDLRAVSVGDEVLLHGFSEGTDVWRVKKISPQNMVHLTEKPVELAVRAIRYSSKKGQSVLDLFGGSGSTLIACEQLARKAFLMELDPPYCDVIRQRWAEFVHGKGCDWQKLAPEIQ